METKPNFSPDTVRLLKASTNGYCAIPGCIAEADDLHHRLPNTKLNNKRFPLFIQSIFNAIQLCRKHHEHYGEMKWLTITDRQAECYEVWLQKFKEEK